LPSDSSYIAEPHNSQYGNCRQSFTIKASKRNALAKELTKARGVSDLTERSGGSLYFIPLHFSMGNGHDN
jgi:hypothetical protein